MTAKEYLDRIKLLDKMIEAKLEEKAQLRDLALKCTVDVSGERVSGSKDNGRMQKVLDKVCDMEVEIDIKVGQLIDVRREVGIAIDNVPEHVYRYILIERYMNGKEWDAIAVGLNYAVRHVTRLHGQAMNVFREKNNLS